MNPDQPNQPSPPPHPPVHTAGEEIIPLSDPHKIGVLFESLLKHPRSLISHIVKGEGNAKLNLSMAILSSLCLLLFGVTVGAFSMHEQLWVSPVKILAGVFLSGLICFPSLYIFSCLTGTRAGLKTIFTGLLASASLMGVLLVSFAPIIWVFSQSTHSYGFMGALFLITWLIAGGFALSFLHKLLRATGGEKLGSLKVWAGVFLLVTLQMSTSLRPIIGRSDDLLTNKKRFFLQHWVDSIGKVTEEGEEERKGADER